MSIQRDGRAMNIILKKRDVDFLNAQSIIFSSKLTFEEVRQVKRLIRGYKNSVRKEHDYDIAQKYIRELRRVCND